MELSSTVLPCPAPRLARPFVSASGLIGADRFPIILQESSRYGKEGALVLPSINTMMFVASGPESRARSDDEAMLGIVEEERQSHRPVPSPPGGQMGVVDDLCVGRRRRWQGIVFLLLP